MDIPLRGGLHLRGAIPDVCRHRADGAAYAGVRRTVRLGHDSIAMASHATRAWPGNLRVESANADLGADAKSDDPYYFWLGALLFLSSTKCIGLDRMRRLQNVFFVLALAAAQAMSADGEEIPYASLEEALKALHAKTGVTFRDEGGWIVADDPEAKGAWLLTPVGHPAYPSIVKRHIVKTADGAYMATEIRCFATKAKCDSYFGGK